MNVDVVYRWLLQLPKSKRSQSQAFTRGKAQTADHDNQEDPASDKSSVCVFNGDHLIGTALDSFVFFDSGNIAEVNQ